MAWQTPKTDWKVEYDSEGRYLGDYFQASDFQRIKGNFETLWGMGVAAASAPHITDVTVSTFGYASIINELERFIDSLHDKYPSFNWVEDTKTWNGNSTAPLAEDFNRIERTQLQFYDLFVRMEEARPKLAFQLNGSEF